MPIVQSVLDLLVPDLFFEAQDFLQEHRLIVKIEGQNVVGSIKIKTAVFMMDAAEKAGLISPGKTTIIESSSGNLGVALSLVCHIRGYAFWCISDPNISAVNAKLIRAYGGKLSLVRKKDANGGYLQTRLKKIAKLLDLNPDIYWTNQYANPANAQAHYEKTAQEILNTVPHVDYLFVGTGTAGTAMGLAQRFCEDSPHTAVIGVDIKGSVAFEGAPKGEKLIPGIGTSQRPPLANRSKLSDLVYVGNEETIQACHDFFQRYGLLVGGSTGSVLAAVRAMEPRLKKKSTVVALSPDLGERYLDTLYNARWIKKNLGHLASTP